MKLYLVSASQNPLITRPILDQLAEGLEEQQFAHLAPFWQLAGVHVGVLDNITELPKEDGASPLVIYDHPDQAGVLGWHTFNTQSGQVHGTAFLDPILQNGGTLLKGPNSLACTLSHEACEATVNPYVNSYVFWENDTGLVAEPIEAADRVEGDSAGKDGKAYEASNGNALSNFLGPRAFRDGIGPFDWLGNLANPRDLSSGGYCERIDLTTGKMNTLWGDLMPEWKRELKRAKRLHKLSRLANAKMQRPAA